MKNNLDLKALEMLDQEDLLKLVKSMVSGGVALSFYGKHSSLSQYYMGLSSHFRPDLECTAFYVTY